MYSIFINDEEVVVESNFEINEEYMNTSSIVFNKVLKIGKVDCSDYSQKIIKSNIYKDDVLVFSGIVKK